MSSSLILESSEAESKAVYAATSHSGRGKLASGSGGNNCDLIAGSLYLGKS